MNLQRRSFFLMGASALIVSACSGNLSNKQSISSKSQGVKRAEHAFGETEVPVNPTRIVVWGYEAVDAVVSHGIQPIGVPNGILDEMPFIPLNKRIIAGIGDPNQPNLEKIATLKPDLILTDKYRGGDAYPRLAQIAPTVAFDIDGSHEWQALTHLCGEVLGKQAETKKLVAAYEAKLQAVRSKLSENSKQPQISIAYIYPGRTGAMGTETFAGSVLVDAGIARPLSQTKAQGPQNISLESLDLLDGDVIFILSLQSNTEMAQEGRAESERVQAHPLWAQLKAVQANQVYEVGSHWAIGSYIAANLILDDLLKYGIGSQ